MRLGTVPREVRLHLPDLLALTRDPATPAAPNTSNRSTSRWATRAMRDAVRPRRQRAHARRDRAATAPAAAATTGTFIVLERFHLAIAVVTIVAATVFLLALTIMLVDERRETVGVLRLIGLPVAPHPRADAARRRC